MLGFTRELTLGFRWLDRPQAWTYTTIHTRIKAAAKGPGGKFSQPRPGFRVAIAEPDTGVRQALAWCVERMEGFRCAGAYPNLQAALPDLRQKPVHLVLVNSSVTDKPAALRVQILQLAAGPVALLPYRRTKAARNCSAERLAGRHVSVAAHCAQLVS